MIERSHVDDEGTLGALRSIQTNQQSNPHRAFLGIELDDGKGGVGVSWDAPSGLLNYSAAVVGGDHQLQNLIPSPFRAYRNLG